MSSKSKDWKEVVIAGGVAGVCSRTAIAPIERIKILYQISSGESGIASLFTTVVKKEGVLRLWRGNSAAVIRVVPYLSTQFLAYEKYKETLIPLFSDTAGATGKNAVTLAAGSAAGVTAVVLTYPLDVVRARMALQQEGKSTTRYKHMFDALVTVGRTEGTAALYRGLSATVGGAAPYTGLKFCAYEALKRTAASILHVDEQDLPSTARVGAGAMAGLMALTAVYPFDVIRRRMQTHAGGARYSSLWNAFTTILNQEGIRKGLYRGLSLNYIKTLPNVAIYLSLYDFVMLHLSASKTLSA
eukprot:m.477605 g.477605  ORF g.477605 m.477605 type:complete len:300 (+) comp21688_c1_seq25:385-1284(+)